MQRCMGERRWTEAVGEGGETIKRVGGLIDLILVLIALSSHGACSSTVLHTRHWLRAGGSNVAGTFMPSYITRAC